MCMSEIKIRQLMLGIQLKVLHFMGFMWKEPMIFKYFATRLGQRPVLYLLAFSLRIHHSTILLVSSAFSSNRNDFHFIFML